MTFGSLFSGIGGIDLGLQRAGMTCAWQVEIDDYCNRVLEKHWPEAPRFRDVCAVGANQLARVDLIAGGFPCQDISNAGKRAGIEGARSGLWGEFARVVRELRPRFVLVENSAALTFRGLGRVLGDLAELGFDAEWSTVSACSMGAPHMRRRVFIVADSDRGPGAQGMGAEPGGQPARSVWGESDGERQGGYRRVRMEARPVGPRVAHGISSRVDRLRGLGNAVVPRVAEFVGRRILESAG